MRYSTIYSQCVHTINKTYCHARAYCIEANQNSSSYIRINQCQSSTSSCYAVSLLALLSVCSSHIYVYWYQSSHEQESGNTDLLLYINTASACRRAQYILVTSLTIALTSQVTMPCTLDMIQSCIYFELHSLELYSSLCNITLLLMSGKAREGGILTQKLSLNANRISQRMYAYGNDIFCLLLIVQLRLYKLLQVDRPY